VHKLPCWFTMQVGQGGHARALSRPCTAASGSLALAPCLAALRSAALCSAACVEPRVRPS